MRAAKPLALWQQSGNMTWLGAPACEGTGLQRVSRISSITSHNVYYVKFDETAMAAHFSLACCRLPLFGDTLPVNRVIPPYYVTFNLIDNAKPMILCMFECKALAPRWDVN